MKILFYIPILSLLLWSCNPNAEKATPRNNNVEVNQIESPTTQDSDTNKNEEDELSEDKIQSLKVAYFTKELNLSTTEAEKFWPIYNKHNSIYQELSDVEWEAIKEGLREVDNYEEEDANQLLIRYKNYLNQRLQNRLTFIEELEKVLTPKKIMLLKHAEYNFNKKLLKQYRSGEATTK